MEGDISSPESPDDTPDNSAVHKDMLLKAMRYQGKLQTGVWPMKSRWQSVANDQPSTNEQEDDDDNPLTCFSAAPFLGMEVFNNPYMDIFNVVMTASGTYDVAGLTVAEQASQSKLPEHLLYVSADDSLESDEEDLFESSVKIQELPTSVVYKVPVPSYPPSVVSSISEGTDDLMSTDEGNESTLKLPAHTKHCIERIVSNHLSKWKGRLKGLTREEYDEVVDRLTQNAVEFLKSEIKTQMTGTE